MAISPQDFCDRFVNSTTRPKFILGRNIYSECVSSLINVDGFIDDFCEDTHWNGKPVLKSNLIPFNALVLNAAGGRMLTAEKRLNELRIENLDYFALLRLTDLPLVEARFNEGFANNYADHRESFAWARQLLQDDISRSTWDSLVSFRNTYDIAYLRGFKQDEENQYFETFLNLQTEGEIFVDVGAFDGQTSIKFIEHCPDYGGVHVFEPDPLNLVKTQDRLSQFKRIHYHNVGASSSSATSQMIVNGSNSSVCASGGVPISLGKIDDFVDGQVSFIKLDIEGSECDALEGAAETILNHHPRLAVAAYHHVDDFWQIPRAVASLRNDYKIFMRHYTESIYETVLFFIPS